MPEALEDDVTRQKRRPGILATVVGGNAAQIPFMITNAQKQQLREMDHDEEAIQNMTPETAHKLLGVRSSPPY